LAKTIQVKPLKHMRLTEKVHELLAEHLNDGDCAIDATAGNGHDSLFLANQVGATGKVIAIDIQASAIETTQARLAAAHLTKRTQLYCADHATTLEALTSSQANKIAAIVFNLGYLPGSDKTIQTQTSSTERALNASKALLCSGGLLCVTAYRGHPGGMEEAALVENWMRALETKGNELACHIPPAKNTPPILWVLKKS
jgi:predicted methyltransferase